MGSIHGAVFLIVGTTVSIISHFLIKSGKNFIAFLWLGIAMAFFGVLKLLFAFIRSQTDIKKKKNVQYNVPHTEKHVHTQHHPLAKYCPRCGLRMHVNYRFCPKCGTQV
jgi:hypothetical protein